MSVMRVEHAEPGALGSLLSRLGLSLCAVPPDEPIPGSFWGDSEAGLVGATLYARKDTPIHSVLHESAHYVCMTPDRRAELERDAGGDDAEEASVCYLQILLSEHLSGMSRARMFEDMDAWGYSFRLGSTEAWFARDSEDAASWLKARGILDADGAFTWRSRAEERVSP